jgi:PKD repeat protein
MEHRYAHLRLPGSARLRLAEICRRSHQPRGRPQSRPHPRWHQRPGLLRGEQWLVSQFSRGEYSGANNLQDDLAVIDTHAPRSPDLPGNAIATAALFSGTQVTGIIESRTDADLFRIDTGAGPISFTAAPASPDANLDIILSLYDSQGVLITSANSTGLNAGFATNVLTGTYYVAVEGGGTSTDNGLTRYTDYASIGQYVLTGNYPSSLGASPVASFTPASRTLTAPGSVAFDSSASYDPEDGPLTYNWDFGDGTFSSAANPTKTYNTAGTYTVSLIVYDETGLSGSTTGTIFAKTPAQTIYVSNTTLTVTSSRKGRQGKAVVTVRDATGAVKSGVTVTGRWSGPVTGTSNVVSTSNGTATFTSAYTKATTAFGFTVTGISLSGAWYDTSRNGVTSVTAQ